MDNSEASAQDQAFCSLVDELATCLCDAGQSEQILRQLRFTGERSETATAIRINKPDVSAATIWKVNTNNAIINSFIQLALSKYKVSIEVDDKVLLKPT